jgi:HEAT repeat protein
MIKWTNISVLALAMIASVSLTGCGPEPEVLEVSAPMALAEARDVMYEEVVSEYDIVRLHATEALDYSVGDEAGDVFIAGLTDDAEGVRFASAMAIGDHEYTPALQEIKLRLVEEESKMVRPGLVYAAYRMGDSTHMPELSMLLFDKDPWVRANSALVMGKVNHPSALRSLKNLLTDESDVDVTIRALESAAMLGDNRSAMRLEGYVKSQFVDDQIDAILGLARIGSERAKSEFHRTFNSEVMAPVVKVAAVGGLGRMRIFDQQGYDYCVRAMQEPYTVLKEMYPEKEVTPAEIRALRQMAVTSLGWMERPVAVNELYPLLKDRDGSIRVAAARSIYQLLPGSVTYIAPPMPPVETHEDEVKVEEDAVLQPEEPVMETPEVEPTPGEDVLPMMEVVPAEPAPSEPVE